MAIAAPTHAPAPSPPRAPRGFSGPTAPDPAIVSACVHCGMCLPVCPTYRETYNEKSSPRGRIHLIGAVAEGRLGIDNPVFQAQMGECLNCRACEAACPTGVHYGAILEAARDQIERHTPRPRSTRWLRRVVYDWLFRDLRRIRFVGRLIQAYQKLGLQRLARQSGVLTELGLDRAEAFTPTVRGRFFRPKGQLYRAEGGVARARVAFLAGCVQSTAFARVNRATIRVLQANGCDVIAPLDQGCCGALHTHGGDLDGGRDLARRNIAAFERAGADWYVVNAAGCGAALKEYGHLLKDDAAWRERAAAFSAKVRDATELLAALGLNRAMRPVALTVTYQDACHLVHAQRVGAAPRELLGAVPGLKLIEMKEASVCCGSAGIYNLTQAVMADRLQQRKVGHVVASGAPVVVSANPGCMLQIEAGLRAAGSNVAVRHIMEILDVAYRPG